MLMHLRCQEQLGPHAVHQLPCSAHCSQLPAACPLPAARSLAYFRHTLLKRPRAMASTAWSIMRATLCRDVRGTPSCTTSRSGICSCNATTTGRSRRPVESAAEAAMMHQACHQQQNPASQAPQ